MLKGLSIFLAVMLITAGLSSHSAQAAPTRVNSCQTISSTGSYILTRNINGSAAAGDCIIIDAAFVTLNLNGFTIGGPGFIGNVPNGSGVAINAQGVTVRNGTVTGWDNGIGSGFSNGISVENIRAIDNDFNGIIVGLGGLVKDSISSGNGASGILFKEGSVIINNVTKDNGDPALGQAVYGISGDCPSTVIGNTAIGNLTNNLNLIVNILLCTDVNNTAP
ncbi:MAG: hypothetical protein GKS02_00090 [Alphaproteobacteria bacterium]|nr:hypothetical protein [Alphaproteobacteria bacterium]